jgi:regulation of enolase protein 1 (concanavalin A-like superfamily)
MPNLTPASITVNNKAIKDFSPEVMQYSYLMKTASEKAPVIAVKAVDAAVAVETVQAKQVPGTAAISLVDYITFDKKEYAVNFGVKSASDEFNTDPLGTQWKVVRENQEKLSLKKQPGSLLIISTKGDITDENSDAENIILQSANTDWTIETKIVCSRKPAGFSENAGIVAFQDDDNFVKLAYRASVGRRGFGPGGGGRTEQPGAVELLVETGGHQKSSVNISMENIIKADNTLFLKLVKKGDAFSAYYSTDGKNFEAVGKANVLLKDIRAGIMACDGVMPAQIARFRRFMQPDNQPKTPFEIAFDYFRITNSGLK